MTTRETVAQKLDYLTPELLAEVDDFIDFVRRKRGTASVLLGALADDPTFVRHDQGTCEQREPLP